MKLFKIQEKDSHRDYYINPDKIVLITTSYMNNTATRVILDKYCSVIVDEPIDSFINRVNKL